MSTVKGVVLTSKDVNNKNAKELVTKKLAEAAANNANETAEKQAVEQQTAETPQPIGKTIAQIIEQINLKAKLVKDLQDVKHRKTTLATAYSEKTLLIAVEASGETYNNREIVKFTNPEIVDFIIKNLMQAADLVIDNLENKILELEK